MLICDAHCDTIQKILDQNKELYENDRHVDIKRMQQAGIAVQFFAMWVQAPLGFSRCVDMLDKFYIEQEKNSEHMDVIRCAEDIDNALQNNKIGAVLTVEGGEALDGRLSRLRALYALGVRGMTLTWNNRNLLADGADEGEFSAGLSNFGREVVAEMNRLGMFIDVSHISERGFWEVVEASKTPVIATHSNAKALCAHRRNLSDDQIKVIINTGGAIGLNFYNEFLAEGREAHIEDVLAHIDYMLSLGAEDVLGFGGDLDGVEELPQGFGGVQDYNLVIEGMLKMGYNESLVRKITLGNMLRYLKQVLR